MSDAYKEIRSVIDVQSGFAFPSTSFIDDGVPVVRMSDLKSGQLDFKNAKYVSDIWLKLCPEFVLNKGDFLLGMSGSLSNHAVVSGEDIPALLNQRVARIKKKGSNGDYRYICFWLRSEFYTRYADIQGEGAAQKNISGNQIAAFKVRLPRLKEQERISEILQALDEVIKKTESLIAKYQKIKAGLMHDLFTRGVTADGKFRPLREQAPELYHETPVGWIPMEWKYEQLQTVLSNSGGYLQTGPFGSQLHANEYTSEGTPVVMPQDINNEMIEVNSIARIPEQRANMLSRHRLKIGDITIARRGELSRAAAVSEREVNWICGTGCFLLRLGRTDLNHFFFSHAYRYDSIQRQIAGIAVGSTMPSLNNSVMSKLFFPVPSPFEQKAISQRLDAIACKITSEQNKLEKLKKQKAGLMQDLLTGKVPVKVDEQVVGALGD